MEIWNKVLEIVAPLFVNVTIQGIITAIIYGCLKGGFNKTINKINVEKISEKATEKGIDKIKEVSFKHSIQPICESELKKINEAANEALEEKFALLQAKYDNIVSILEHFAAYFDDSMVTEEKKAELKKAIETAKNKPQEIESVVVEEIVKEDTKTPTKATQEAKPSKSVQR